MDEELFFEAIIASERVARWIGDLRAGTKAAAAAAAAAATSAVDDGGDGATATATAARAVAAAAKAAQALARAVAAENACGGPYSEAAEEQGAPRCLTAMMARLCAAGESEEEEGDDGDDEEGPAATTTTTTPKAEATTKAITAASATLRAARRDALAAAGRAMAALSGPMACGGRVVSFPVDALGLPPRGRPLRVREGAISDGLGARVWALAHVALRELAANPGLVAGKRVLEIGAGTGLLGVAAARLGAASPVVVSDHEPAVLRILRACAHLNAAAIAEARGGGEEEKEEDGGLPSVHSSEVETVEGSDDDDDDEEEEEEREGEAGAAAAVAAARKGDNVDAAADASAASKTWHVAGGALQVRAFDWADSIAALDGEAEAAPLRLFPVAADADAPQAGTNNDDLAPTLPSDHAFDLVIGSEVMYEPVHARLVAAALAHRLAPPASPSRALLACAGRERRVFEAFARHCRERGLRYRAVAIRPTAADYSDGILARHRAAVAPAAAAAARLSGDGGAGNGNGAPAAAEKGSVAASAASSRVEYEGGFLLMAVDWGAGAVAGSGSSSGADGGSSSGGGDGWHRTDFAEGLVDGSAAPLETA